MNNQQFISHAEKAYDVKEINPQNIYMFNFSEFYFSYDDDNKKCTISCPVSDSMLNPSGILYGGISKYIADTAMGQLNYRFKGAAYVSLDLNTSYLKAKMNGIAHRNKPGILKKDIKFLFLFI